MIWPRPHYSLARIGNLAWYTESRKTERGKEEGAIVAVSSDKGGMGELEPNKTPAENVALFYNISSTAFLKWSLKVRQELVGCRCRVQVRKRTTSVYR